RDGLRPTPMDPLKGILRNSSMLIAAQAVSSAIGMLLLVLFPRFLGDAEFGRLHLALSLAMMFAVGAEFGLPPVVARAVSQRRSLARPYLVTAVRISLGLGVILYAALLALTVALGYPPRVRVLTAILGVMIFGEALAQVLGAVFQAHERLLIPALAR